jgi:hypothetical protein
MIVVDTAIEYRFLTTGFVAERDSGLITSLFSRNHRKPSIRERNMLREAVPHKSIADWAANWAHPLPMPSAFGFDGLSAADW